MTTSTPSRPSETIRIADERVQRVGVEDERNSGALEQPMHEGGGARRLPEARADGDDVRLEIEDAIERGEVDRPGGRFLERLRSCIRVPSPRRSADTISASRW